MDAVVRALNAEWSGLARSSDAIVVAWGEEFPALAEAGSLEEVLEVICHSPDGCLRSLITLAQMGDRLAARTVVQTMLGKLVLMSNQGLARSHSASLEDLVGQMWITVLDYPLASRPRKVAANLALDTLKAARRLWQDSHLQTAPVDPTDLQWMMENDEGHFSNVPSYPTCPESQLIEADLRADELVKTAFRLGLITRDTANLLIAIYGPHELSGALAAEVWGISPAAVRTRCKKAVHRMSDHRHDLAA